MFVNNSPTSACSFTYSKTDALFFTSYVYCIFEVNFGFPCMFIANISSETSCPHSSQIFNFELHWNFIRKEFLVFVHAWIVGEFLIFFAASFANAYGKIIYNVGTSEARHAYLWLTYLWLKFFERLLRKGELIHTAFIMPFLP